MAQTSFENLPAVFHVVEANEIHPRHQRLERLAVLILMGGRDRAHGAPMEAVFQRQKLRPDLRGLRSASAPSKRRASFIAASIASVPLLQKNARSSPVLSVSRSASSACPW